MRSFKEKNNYYEGDYDDVDDGQIMAGELIIVSGHIDTTPQS